MKTDILKTSVRNFKFTYIHCTGKAHIKIGNENANGRMSFRKPKPFTKSIVASAWWRNVFAYILKNVFIWPWSSYFRFCLINLAVRPSLRNSVWCGVNENCILFHLSLFFWIHFTMGSDNGLTPGSRHAIVWPMMTQFSDVSRIGITRPELTHWPLRILNEILDI